MPKPSNMNPRIVVTGGAGFIGANFVHFALSQNCEVTNLDCLTYASYRPALDDLSAAKNYRFIEASIADSQVVSELLHSFAPDVVVHFAAETHVDRSIASAEPFVQTNILGTYQLVEQIYRYWRNCSAANRDSFRLIHVSTDEVYGELLDAGYFVETSPYRPRSPYSASKAAADHLVRAWGHTYNLPAIIVHPSNCYGPNQHAEKLIPMSIQRCLDRQPIPIYGDGQNVRDWLFVLDLCQAVWLLARNGEPGQSYNVGANNPWRNLDLVQKICRLVDAQLKRPLGSSEQLIQFVADRPGHDFRYAMDSSKVLQLVNWKPSTEMEQGLKQTIRWYFENPDRLRPPHREQSEA